MVNRIINPGEKYNSLTTLNTIRVNNSSYWECECDCGTITRTLANHLRTGRVKSCGCLQYSNPSNPKGSTRILGEQYGSYTILAKDSKDRYVTKCDCGNNLYLSHSQLYYYLSKPSCACNELDIRNRTAKVKKEILTKTSQLRKIGLTKAEVVKALSNEYDLDVLKRVVSQSRISNSSNA